MRIVSYNIDGLPERLDLMDLPLVFRPAVWVCKWIRKTTIISMNDNADRESKTFAIGDNLCSLKPDLIAVQEDFNYHDELISGLYTEYNQGTCQGGIDFKKIFSSVRWFPYPRLKADGLNLFTRKGVFVSKEEIVRWKKSHGYFSGCNDKLTLKGFRYYNITIEGKILDVYILHMDATYRKEGVPVEETKDSKAREVQLRQLACHIIEKNTPYPIVIVGDTNLDYCEGWDKRNIVVNFGQVIKDARGWDVQETFSEHPSIDKCFFINKPNAEYRITAESRFLRNFSGLSDHLPLMIDIIWTEA